jgi:parallel beta-helix repeat protein
MKKKNTRFLIVLIMFLTISIQQPMMKTQSPSHHITIIVDNEGDGDFIHIQEAINAAGEGDTISIYSGIYNETITINKQNIHLEGINHELGSGADTDYPIIKGDSSSSVITINGTHNSIAGCIIQQSGSDYFDAGIAIMNDFNSITSNAIAGNFYGIVLNNCTNTTIEMNYILSNVMDGIYICYSSGNSINENTIKENGYQGIFLYDTTHNTIQENIISLNGKDGIHLRDHCFNNIIEKNTINSNNVDGIKTMFSDISNNYLIENNIYSNRWNGIHLLLGEHNYILRNNITQNLYNGIHIGDSDQNTITKNTIKENQEDGLCILFEGSENNVIYHNNFISDTAFDSGYNQWDNGPTSEGNYWSNYNGPDHNDDGIGDTPYEIPGGENKDRYPFLYLLSPPLIPSRPSGTTLGLKGETYTYIAQSTGNQHTQIQYGWDWDGDLLVDEWTIFYLPDQPCETSHSWSTNGTYQISVKAMDTHGFQSDWSEPLSVTMPSNDP